MSDPFTDIGDGLDRLGQWLLDQKEETTRTILTGDLLLEDYKGYCQRLAQITDTLERIEMIRKGEDRPKRRQRLPSVEC